MFSSCCQEKNYVVEHRKVTKQPGKFIMPNFLTEIKMKIQKYKPLLHIEFLWVLIWF